MIKTKQELLNHFSEINAMYNNPFMYQTLSNMIDELLEQQPIDKSAMMYEIYMEGVNMSGEYQGCWVRFKDIEKIVDKYMTGGENE